MILYFMVSFVSVFLTEAESVAHGLLLVRGGIEMVRL